MKSLRILTENNKAGPKNYFHFFTFKSYLKEKKPFVQNTCILKEDFHATNYLLLLFPSKIK